MYSALKNIMAWCCIKTWSSWY